nr:MAG TPA: hypothetical protein [Caudoviricetes sp.]
MIFREFSPKRRKNYTIDIIEVLKKRSKGENEDF